MDQTSVGDYICVNWSKFENYLQMSSIFHVRLATMSHFFFPVGGIS